MALSVTLLLTFSFGASCAMMSVDDLLCSRNLGDALLEYAQA